jgi:hypothetical protein
MLINIFRYIFDVQEDEIIFKQWESDIDMENMFLDLQKRKLLAQRIEFKGELY